MNFDDLCLGVVTKNGYYLFGSNIKILTDKTKNISEGTYIKPDFTPLTTSEICVYFGISKEKWTQIHLGIYD